MSQATNKESGFSSEQHLQLLRCLMSERFHSTKTYRINLKLRLI